MCSCGAARRSAAGHCSGQVPANDPPQQGCQFRIVETLTAQPCDKDRPQPSWVSTCRGGPPDHVDQVSNSYRDHSNWSSEVCMISLEPSVSTRREIGRLLSGCTLSLDRKIPVLVVIPYAAATQFLQGDKPTNRCLYAPCTASPRPTRQLPRNPLRTPKLPSRLCLNRVRLLVNTGVILECCVINGIPRARACRWVRVPSN